MELSDLVYVIKRRWWILVLGAVLAMVAGYAAMRYLTPWPRYQATATVLVGSSDDELDFATLQLGRDLAPTYVEWTKRRPVLQGAIDALGLDTPYEELQGRIDVRAVRDTQLMEISATARDPEEAAAIANEVAWQLTQQPLPLGGGLDDTQLSLQGNVSTLRRRIESAKAELASLGGQLAAAESEAEVARLTGLLEATQSNLAVWEKSYSELTNAYTDVLDNFVVVAEEAAPPSQPLKPWINVFVAGITGFVLATGLVVVLEQLDTTVKPSTDLSKSLSIPFLGTVVPLKDPTPVPLQRRIERTLVRDDHAHKFNIRNLPRPDISYHHLVANIARENGGSLARTILVTSPSSEMDHEMAGLGLALALSETGNRTVLVDASLYRPVLHTWLGLPNTAGLVNLLNGGQKEDNPVPLQPLAKNRGDLWVVTRGSTPYELEVAQSSPLPVKDDVALMEVTAEPVEDDSEPVEDDSEPENGVSPRLVQAPSLEAGLDELAGRTEEPPQTIVVNGPAVLSGPEAIVMAAQVDYVMLVLDARKTRIDEAQQAVELLKVNRGVRIGSVIFKSY
jgi:succinoglycan biosynthesis transport protein ExoP